MPNARRRILEVTITVALTLCAGLLLLANAKSASSRNVVDRIVLGIASPLERAVSWVVSGIGDVGNRYVWLRDIDSENSELRVDNERLRGELSAALGLAADTKALEALLEFKIQTDARTLGARLIAGSLSPHYRLIRVSLDRGSDEVARGMPVVTGSGLVGRVESAVAGTCEVLLVTDPRSSVDVLLPRTGGRGVLSGLATSDRYAAKMEQLDRAQPIRVGDPVVTSGLGGGLPAGVEVGSIAAIASDPSSLYQDVEVRPSVEFSSLDRVLILLTVPPATEEEPVESAKPMAGRVRGI